MCEQVCQVESILSEGWKWFVWVLYSCCVNMCEIESVLCEYSSHDVWIGVLGWKFHARVLFLWSWTLCVRLKRCSVWTLFVWCSKGILGCKCSTCYCPNEVWMSMRAICTEIRCWITILVWCYLCKCWTSKLLCWYMLWSYVRNHSLRWSVVVCRASLPSSKLKHCFQLFMDTYP